MSSISANWRDVLSRVASSAVRAGRSPSEIRVVAVTKMVPPARMREAILAGAADLGENRIQEAKEKFEALSKDSVAWHLVGHLQTNKVKEAVRMFSLIHSVDRLELARNLSEEAGRQGKTLAVLAQINVAREPTKGGFTVEEAHAAVEDLRQWPHLEVRGLMTIAPLVDDPETLRPLFRQVKGLFDSLFSIPPSASRLPQYLSMGMSRDFEIAVEEGANLLRIGTAIFGEWPKP